MHQNMTLFNYYINLFNKPTLSFLPTLKMFNLLPVTCSSILQRNFRFSDNQTHKAIKSGVRLSPCTAIDSAPSSKSAPSNLQKRFSNSLTIHQVKTKKITNTKEVWIPILNQHRLLLSFCIVWEDRSNSASSSAIQTSQISTKMRV